MKRIASLLMFSVSTLLAQDEPLQSSSASLSTTQEAPCPGDPITTPTDENPAYTLLKTTLSTYNRPFTLLDLASGEELLLKIAEEFPASTIVSFTEPTEGLTSLPNLVLLSEKPTLAILQKLSEVEHFDVVLALNFQPENPLKGKAFTPKMTLGSLASLGQYFFFQLAAPDKGYQKALHNQPSLKEHDALTQIYLFEDSLRAHLKSHWFSKEADYYLFSTPEKRFRTHASSSNWSVLTPEPQGISLPTFIALQGVYPLRETLKEGVEKLPWSRFPNLGPWDLKVTGNILLARPSYAPLTTTKESPVAFALSLLDVETREALKEALAPAK
jgi:hypothetical protein